MNLVDDKNPDQRKLWHVKAVSREAEVILCEARRLALTKEYCGLSDAELIRKAFGACEDPRQGRY